MVLRSLLGPRQEEHALEQRLLNVLRKVFRAQMKDFCTNPFARAPLHITNVRWKLMSNPSNMQVSEGHVLIDQFLGRDTNALCMTNLFQPI